MAVVSISFPVHALPPCPVTGRSPRVVLPEFRKDSVNEVTGVLAVEGMATANEDIDRVDFFIGDTAVATERKDVDLKLLDPPKADMVRFEFKVDVAMNAAPSRLTMQPGKALVHVYARTASGQCGKSDVEVNGRQARVFAVVVGVNEPNANLRPLRYAYDDALAFKGYLENDLRIPPGNIRVLPDKADTTRTADATTIGEELERLKELQVQADTVFFFFSGHGVLIDKKQYLVPMRGNIRHPKTTLLKLDTVEELLNDSNARRKVFFIDACNIGEIEGQRGLTVPEIGKKGPLEDLTPLWSNWSGSFGIAASGPSEPSWEHKSIGGGVFTHYLIEAFRKAKADEKHRVTLRAVYDYVTEYVPKFAQGKLDPPVQEQHPFLIDSKGEAERIEIGYH